MKQEIESLKKEAQFDRIRKLESELEREKQGARVWKAKHDALKQEMNRTSRDARNDLRTHVREAECAQADMSTCLAEKGAALESARDELADAQTLVTSLVAELAAGRRRKGGSWLFLNSLRRS